MSNAGQAVLSVAGAAVGFWLGGPAGAAWGFSLGGMAGSALFPTDLGTISGPRLNDLNVQTSMVGAPIPIVYGTYAISGNVIWSSGLIEAVSRKKQGGKGGPTQTVKTYSYSVNCAVGICEGEIGGISRIWADAKLIYDARPQLDDETATQYTDRMTANAAFLANAEFYVGTEDQLPDPTIESYEGAGNVSAFRGLVYVVFSEFQLADYGNRIPNFRFEVSAAPALTQAAVIETSGPVMHPWLVNEHDPRNPLNGHTYNVYGVGDFATFEDAFANRLASYPGLLETPLGWSLSYGTNQLDAIGPIEHTFDDEQATAVLWFGYEMPSTYKPGITTSSTSVFTANISPFDETIYHCGTTNSIRQHGLYFKRSSSAVAYPVYGVGASKTLSAPSVGLTGTQGYKVWYDIAINCYRTMSPPEGDGWELIAGTAKALSVYYTGAEPNNMGGYIARSVVLAGYTCDYIHRFVPNGVLRVPGHAEYNDQAWWEARYAEAVAADTAPAGKVYGVDYPKVVSEYYQRVVFEEVPLVPAGQTTLGAIVADVCDRCGLPAEQIDVTDLSEIVHGYAVTRVMTGRDAIGPLRSYGWFDCVESDGALTWPTRGKAAVAALTDDDLAAHASGDSRPSAVETQRTQDVELPRRLRVHYAQTEFNYEPGEQSASRIAAGNVEVRDMEVAVSMSDTKAAQIADVVLYDLWVSRNRYRLTVDHSLLSLEPADAVTVPIDGRQERLRIVSVNHSLPGLLRLECVRDDDGVYESYAIGNPASNAGTGGGTIAIPGTADLVLLDLPMLRDTDNDAGYYAAVQAVGGNTFGGAILFRSADGGNSYDEIATFDSQATIGTLAEALPAGPSTIVDGGSVLVVDVDADLESFDLSAMLAGRNAAAIGADGRWEIIQFSSAFQVDSPPVWRLTGLLRGRRGTEWAIGSSQVGDRFVLLDSAVVRVPMNLASVGASRPHKAVLVGTSLEATAAVNFAGLGVAMEPFSVVHVAGERDAGDLTITWIRRGRIGQELPGNTDIPLSEASESYEVDILDGVTVVRTISVTSQSASYTSAQQVADFGSLQASIAVRIYQLSATVGRGYPTEATL